MVRRRSRARTQTALATCAVHTPREPVTECHCPHATCASTRPTDTPKHRRLQQYIKVCNINDFAISWVFRGLLTQNLVPSNTTQSLSTLMSAAKARGRATFALSGTDIQSRTVRALAPVRRGPLAAMHMQARASAHRAPCVLSDILSHTRVEVCHVDKEFSESRNPHPAHKGR